MILNRCNTETAKYSRHFELQFTRMEMDRRNDAPEAAKNNKKSFVWSVERGLAAIKLLTNGPFETYHDYTEMMRMADKN